MFWTPKILPPDPSTIPTLSPLAESVLAMIRDSDSAGGKRRDTCYKSSSDSLHNTSSSWNPKNIQRRSREDVEAAGDCDFPSPVAMNSITSGTLHHTRCDGNPMSTIDHPPPSNSFLPSSKINVGVPLVANNIQNRHSESYFYNQSSQSNQNVFYDGPHDRMKNNIGITPNYNLSPDMEFDDIEIYSCPFDKLEGCSPIKTFHQKSAQNMLKAVNNNLNFKEIKPRPLQKRGLQIDTSLPLLNHVSNVTLASSKLEPSDQTFVFTTNSDPKFKKRLANFKHTPIAKSNSNIHFKKQCKTVTNTIGNKTHNVEQLLNKVIPASLKDSIHPTLGSKNCKEHFVENQENQGPIVWTNNKQSKQSSFATDCSNLNQQSKLSVDVLAKTDEREIDKEANCVQSRVNYKNKPKQSEELIAQAQLQRFENTTNIKLTRNQQLDFSQDRFAKTQESEDCSLYRTNEIEAHQSEEFSIPPYQKPIENSVSRDFDVDDLFSLEDKSFDGSFGVLKNDIANTNISKSSGDEGKCLPMDNEIENLNLTTAKATFKEEFRSSSRLYNGPKRMMHNTNEESLKSGNTSSLTFSSPKVKSHYFQTSNESISIYDQQIYFDATNLKQNKEIDKLLRLENGNEMVMQTNTGEVDAKNVMKLDTEVEKGNITAKYLSKKHSLKQATLFDCRKSIKSPNPIKNNVDPLTNNQGSQVETPLQSDKFKKPSLPAKKSKPTKKINSVKKMKSENVYSDKKSKSSLDESGFLQSNTSIEEIKQKCDPSKFVQTSLIKNEPVKRSAEGTIPKKSKKLCFVPPTVASHLTSEKAPLNNYTITVLDDVTAKQVLQKLDAEEINKVVTTVAFREGYTLLNKPEDQKKNSRCFPSGVMYMIVWDTGKFGYYWLPLSDPASVTPAVVKLVDTLMSKSERNICFEAQAVYMLLMDMLKFKEIYNWNAYDPLIASWLLDPDNPPKDFQETSNKLNMERSLLIVHPQANTKNQACDLLQVLDIAMNILQNRLVTASLWTVFTDMETKLIPILAVMESSSIQVDMKKLHRTAEAMDKKLRHLQNEAHKLADRWFQLNSPQQLREILFDKLKLDEKFNLKVKKTEHGEKSTSESVLEQMKELHPLPKIILEYRRLQKLKSTYVDGLLQHVRSDGTIGTSWEQVSAATGRITSKNPNLQAFPKCPITVQEGETVHLREMFMAREGCSFLAADFHQIEFRVFAHFTQDRSLLQAFREGGDIFQRLAERWLGGKGEEEREKTKRIVYSVMYGAGANKLSEYLHVEPSEAYKIINNFVAIFPSLRSLPRTVIAKCREQGFVSALSGRRRLFPHIQSTNGKLRSYSERQAMNFLIQGSAADICKAAMLDCEAEIRSRGLRAKLLLMIHDELIWEVDDCDLQETAKTVKSAMEHRWNERLTLLVPIPVSVSTGKTLANMQPLEE